MSSSSTTLQKAVPAQLRFFAIYNPSLGNTDETLEDQIVYYSSPETREKYHQYRRSGKGPTPCSQDEKNERLRQIGLAQGMVKFSGFFSDGKAVDTIETDQSRIILHELEAGWWLIASISLTKLPARTNDTSVNGNPTEHQSFECSSREVKPPALLLQDLLRAQSTFLLHHASSMNALFVRTRRSKFVSILGRYWDTYLSTWNVMLHGNPIVNVYGGIKLAASGELGVGVGEEDRGSGEREVLEGFIERIDGLVDLVVSKFGDVEPEAEVGKSLKGGHLQSSSISSKQWLGTGSEPTPEDGAIFLGVGALSRKSLRDVIHWMEDIYSWGPRAYGVEENPTLTRKSRKKGKVDKTPKNTSPFLKDLKKPPTGPADRKSSDTGSESLVGAQSHVSPVSSEETHRRMETREILPSLQKEHASQPSEQNANSRGGIASYFKFGYGTHWTLGPISSPEQIDKSAEGETQVLNQTTNRVKGKDVQPMTETASTTIDVSIYPVNDSIGHFLIGLRGDIEDERPCETNCSNTTQIDDREEEDRDSSRTLVRTVTVEFERGDAREEKEISTDSSDEVRSRHGGTERTDTSHTPFESQDRQKTKELRVVVYVHRPFIFTFLFELETAALTMVSLYRSLHQQLKPLQRSLLLSTNYRLPRPEVTTSTAESKSVYTPIYDFIWDSKLWTITSTIPNIPEPTHPREKGTSSAPWTRIEALNTHMQLLNTFTDTRKDRLQIERTCKTRRSWWVVWTRILDPDIGSSIGTTPTLPRHGSGTPLLKSEDSGAPQRPLDDTSVTDLTTNQSVHSGPARPFSEREDVLPEVSKGKEILLIRRASDYTEKTTSRFVSTNSVTGETGWGSGPAKLAQGIGVDTKRYIGELLNMN